MIARMEAGGLEIGFLLDRQWHVLRGEMEQSKRLALLSLGQVLAATGTPYAIIGGVALQVHQAEPRTTLDINLAVKQLESIPRCELQRAGFVPRGRFSHSENWQGPDGTPVQFTDDPSLSGAIERAQDLELGGERLRVIGIVNLLHEKLRA